MTMLEGSQKKGGATPPDGFTKNKGGSNYEENYE